MAPAIRVENLSKQYRLGARGRDNYRTLRESLASAFVGPLRRLRRQRGLAEPSNEFWALKDVSFDVPRGEVVGIIGRNGAGKSTLLKILSRTVEPTSGRAIVRGRMSSLLEVGTGFHPELTGRENIYLNGSILGMKRKEIERKFDEIVAFSEIEKFLDTPVKRYSSGMYVRLAFAVAAHMEPEILIVDEVLAVGDYEFQKKCIGQMQSLGKKGRTILFVTHNMAVMSRLCQSAILIESGQIAGQGSPLEMINRYLQTRTISGAKWQRAESPTTESGLSLLSMSVQNRAGRSCDEFRNDEPFDAEIVYEVRGRPLHTRIVFEVETEQGMIVFATTDCDEFGGQDRERTVGTHKSRCVFPTNLLAPGTYYLTAAASWTNRREWDRVRHALRFQVSRIGSLSLIDQRPGVVAPILQWETGNR
jgi:lipopolysaccharide transport system ATP-binding protein